MLIGLVAIIAGSMLIDYYAELLYPLVELGELTVPDLQVGDSSRFEFFKEDTMVGSYTYSIVEVDDLGPGKTYTTRHVTEVNYSGESIQLEGLYRFDSSYRPLGYSLNATIDEDVQTISCSFNPGSVTITVVSQGASTDLTLELPDGAILVENSMPGYWELLFQSSTFERGMRYSVDALVPQAGRVTPLTLVVEKDLSQARVGDQVLECTVIKEADHGLTFYIYGGEVVQYRDEAQGVLLRKVS